MDSRTSSTQRWSTRLEGLIPLATLHRPLNLAAMPATWRSGRAELPQVACTTPLPRCHAVLARAVKNLPWSVVRGRCTAVRHPRAVRVHRIGDDVLRPAGRRGKDGCAALRQRLEHVRIGGRRSVASTIGFSAVEGLPMGTRCGSLESGAILYLMDHHGMEARSGSKQLYNQSGLLGFLGTRAICTHCSLPYKKAQLTVDLYGNRIRRELGSLFAALGGSTPGFTGGNGKRPRACARVWPGRDLAGRRARCRQAPEAPHSAWGRVCASTF